MNPDEAQQPTLSKIKQSTKLACFIQNQDSSSSCDPHNLKVIDGKIWENYSHAKVSRRGWDSDPGVLVFRFSNLPTERLPFHLKETPGRPPSFF